MSRKLKQVISCQSFSPISDVRDGIIVTKDGKFVKLMEFSPINYGLRSNEDKNMITAQYAAAIRSFPSVVQIKVLSNRANVEHYISGMVESVRHEKNEGTRELMREQIDMMSEFGTSQGVSRRFFLAFQYEEEEGFAHRSPSWNEIRSTITRQEDAIRSNLRACGNIMISRPHDDVYVLSTLYDIMSRAQSANHPFDERMADVVARRQTSTSREIARRIFLSMMCLLRTALIRSQVPDISSWMASTICAAIFRAMPILCAFLAAGCSCWQGWERGLMWMFGFRRFHRRKFKRHCIMACGSMQCASATQKPPVVTTMM